MPAVRSGREGGSSIAEVSDTRVAVIGHVEWMWFLRVDTVPEQGAIVHATEGWEVAGGGGAVAAAELARLAGEATLFTALGDEDLGRRAAADLESRGVRVRAAHKDTPQRRGVSFLDQSAERTITTLGERLHPSGDDPLPWEDLRGADAVYITAADPGAFRAAREARAVVATSRIMGDLIESGIHFDAVVGSAEDPAEAYKPMDPPPGVVVMTEGKRGGRYRTADGSEGRYEAVPVPGPPRDAYGAGDSFAAGLTFALGSGLPLSDALTAAARSGARALTRRGA